MRKFFSLIAAVLFAGSMMATVESVDFSAQGYENQQAIEAYTGTNFTVAFDKGGSQNGPKYYTSGTAIRCYAGNKITFASKTAEEIIQLVITFGASDGTNAITANVGTFETATWTGSASSVELTIGGSTGNRRIKAVEVTFGAAPAVATPVITGDAVFFDSTIVTVSCSTQNADIYYTTDGTTDPKCDCPAAPEYKKPFVLKATTTVKAAAYTGNDWSAVAEKVFTKAPEYASFEALIADSLATNTLVKVSFENIKIDSIYTSSQNKRQGIYFTVGEKAYEIYYNKAEVPETWVVGGTVSGTINGNWTLYAKANIWEIVPSADDWNWALNYTAPTPIGAPEFYVVGSMTDWATDAAWKLEANPNKEGEYLGEFTFAAGDQLKVVGVVGNVTTWYPGGETPNYTINNAGKCVVYFRPDGQGGDDWFYGYFNVIMVEPIVSPYVYNWAENIGTTIMGGNSNITVATVKIHENTDDVTGIKFGSSYVYAEGKWVAIKPAEGAFKAGDTLKVSVVYNNTDATKYCMVDLRAADGDTRIWMSDSLSTLNGRNAGDPVVQNYVLQADADSLFLGRYGNTGMFVTLLQVVKGEAPVVEPVYTVVGSSAPLFGKTWDPTYEANNMEPITGSKYLYAWKKENVALAAGKIEFKVCEDHAWTKAWPAKNYELALAEEGLYDIAIFFNPEFGDSAVYAVAEFKGSVVVLPTIMLHGNFTGTWADTKAFTPAADSLTASLELALTEGTYEFGFKFDGAWKANGANITREANTTNLAEGSGNMFVTADVPGNYIFTYTYATQDVVVTYPNPIIVPDTITIELSSIVAPGVIKWTDAVATEGWWQMQADAEDYYITLSNIDTLGITQAAGIYTVDALDPSYSYIYSYEDSTYISFVDGGLIITDANGVINAMGQFEGSDGNIYQLDLTYVDPKIDVTVNVTVSNGTLIDKYAAYGLYGVYGYADDNSAYVQLGIWAEEGFQGNFTEDDLDNKYIGSGVVVAAGAQTIYSAAIEVIPGDAEGNYLITADILCYNNTLYKVTMTIGEAQGLEGVDAAVKAIKRLVNGQLVIEKAGKTYNAAGNLVR